MSARITKADIESIRGEKRNPNSPDYDRALDAVIALIGAKERRSRAAKAKEKHSRESAEESAAKARKRAIAGKGPEAGGIYDALLESAKRKTEFCAYCGGGSGPQFEVVVGKEGDPGSRTPDEEKESKEAASPSEALSAFYAMKAKYPTKRSLRGNVVTLEDDKMGEVIVLARYDGTEVRSVNETYHCW